MGIHFGDNGSMLNNIASGIGSFLRSQKTTGADSATGAQSMKALKGKNDEFEKSVNLKQDAPDQAQVDFTAETQEACEWASGQTLAEAVDHFENQEVGNGLMMMSLIEK